MEHLTSQKAYNNLETHQNDDEIDLKELLVSLWEGKFIIMLVSFTFFLVGMAYSLIVVEKWEAKAIIAQPELSQFKLLQNQISQLQPIFNEYSNEDGIVRSNELDEFKSPEALLTIFVQQFNNQENKKQYLNQNIDFKKQFDLLVGSDNGGLNRIEVQSLYHTWYEKLGIRKLSKSNSDQLNDSYRVFARSNSSAASYDLLLDYMKVIDAKSRKTLQQNLKSLINSKKSELKQQVNILKVQAKSQLYVERIRSEFELSITKSAGISKPLENYDADPQGVFSIGLGSDALVAKIKVLNSINNLSLFDPMIAQYEAKLSFFDNFKIKEDIGFQVMQYVEPPEKPFSRLAPNRKMISLLGGGVGAVLGVVVILIGVAFRKRETQIDY